MTAWGKNSKLLLFQNKFINGLLNNGYSRDFAERTFEQVKGFGGYGFPESHSASFALLAYASSWLKCHHPAAFCCALLNSQPMGFYSPSQLLQDLRRHGVPVLPVDVNASEYDHTLERVETRRGAAHAVRLGFREIKSLKEEEGKAIATGRGTRAFTNVDDFNQRVELSRQSLQLLASADALRSLLGDRHRAHWHVAAVGPQDPLPEVQDLDQLVMDPPTLEKDILDDYRSLGLTLRTHPMALLRQQKPFSRCTKCVDLVKLRHKSLVRIAGLVTGLQKPGTAKGTLFMTIEDETGNINVVIWGSTQQHFRQAILTSRLVVIKGTVEIATEHVAQPVIHVIAGHIADATHELQTLVIKARMFR
jgi:error-prone DNA polymerase